jgi:hypothetical protein
MNNKIRELEAENKKKKISNLQLTNEKDRI